MRKLIFMSVCAMTVMVQAEDLIPAGAKNLATSSGPKTTKSANMHTYNSLFNGVRDRWLGYKPNPTTEYYPSETVTFTESRPLVNAYRVWRGQRAHFQLRQEERSRRPRLRMGCRVQACRDR